MRRKLSILLLLGLPLLFLVSCAGTSARTQELLARDHQTMSDQEILTYYFQLNDQIARVERETSGTSVGFGAGTGSMRVGVSQGITRRNIAEDLRDRRNQVRAELTLRGLRP